MSRFAARLLPISMLAACVVLSTVWPASASVGTATLTAASPTSNGPCPFTETFTGSIAGSPGTTFVYAFNRYIDGVQHVQTIGAATMPASGSLAVSDSFGITTTSTGINFDQIWVHNISGGQADVYSARASFSVTCGGGTPTPSGAPSSTRNFKPYTQSAGAGTVTSVLKIPAPYGAKTTNDVTECGKHLTGLSVFLSPVCGEVLAQGGADIVFKWDGNDRYPNVDGFRAYDADTHQLDSKITSSAGTSATVLFKRPPLPSGCYVVRAYKGTEESNDSNRVCFYPTTTKTVTINPTEFYTYGWYSDEVIDYNNVFATPEISSNTTMVGYWHQHPLRTADPSVRRAGLYYNLTTLGAHFIFKATLHLKVYWTKTNPDPSASEFSNIPSCLYEIAPGTGKWWRAADTKPESSFDDPQRPTPAANVDLDVTAWTRPWLNDQVNFGLVLRGRDEDRNERGPNRCTTSFFTPTLEITYN